MGFFHKVVEYFDLHPGYQLLLSFSAFILSTIPYIWKFFAKRFRLKATPLAYKYFLYNDGKKQNLAIQIAVTNLSETPCTITQAFLMVGGREQYISAASENIFHIAAFGNKTGEYFSLPLPQHISPHQGISGCFILPDFYIELDELKSSKCAIKLICGNKTKIVPIDFNGLRTPLYL